MFLFIIDTEGGKGWSGSLNLSENYELKIHLFSSISLSFELLCPNGSQIYSAAIFKSNLRNHYYYYANIIYKNLHNCRKHNLKRLFGAENISYKTHSEFQISLRYIYLWGWLVLSSGWYFPWYILTVWCPGASHLISDTDSASTLTALTAGQNITIITRHVSSSLCLTDRFI